MLYNTSQDINLAFYNNIHDLHINKFLILIREYTNNVIKQMKLYRTVIHQFIIDKINPKYRFHIYLIFLGGLNTKRIMIFL